MLAGEVVVLREHLPIPIDWRSNRLSMIEMLEMMVL